MANLQDSANILIIYEKEIHLHYLICSLQIIAMLPVGMSSPVNIRKLLSTCFEVSVLQQFLGAKITSGRPKTSGALTGMPRQLVSCRRDLRQQNVKELDQTQHTVDGQNPAPPRMIIIPLSIGF